jgi:hypothetical protein
MNPILPDKSVLDKCFTHFQLMHGSGSLPGVYYFMYGGSFGAKQVTPVGADAYPVDNRDAYYSTFPQSKAPDPGKRGKKVNVTGAGAFFAEYDAQDFLSEAEIAPFFRVDLADPERNSEQKARTTAKKAALTQSQAFFNQVLNRIRTKIASLPIAPSSILASGGGYHLFWYFTSPVRFDDDATRQRFEAALEAWVTFNGGDGGAKDIDRVLRVPGTVNAKKHYVAMAGAPLPVTWESFDADRRYSYEALCGAMPATWDAPAQAAKVRQTRKFTGASAPTPARTAGSLPDLPAVRRFNATERIDDWLTKTGCTFVRFDGEGDRWLPPQSTTGNPAIWKPKGKNFVWSFSEHNPVGRDGKLTAADFAIAHDFGGNVDRFLESLSPAESSSPIDYAGLRQFVRSGAIEPFVRKNLALLAEQAAALAEAAAQAYADNPTAQTEAAALALRKRADKAAARVTAPRWPEVTVLDLMLAIIDDFAEATERYPDLEAKHISTLGLAARANMNPKTVTDNLPLVLDWFVVREATGAKRAPRYRLARVALDVVEIGDVCHPTDQSSPICTTSPLLSHYAHDAFRTCRTPLADTPANRAHVATVTAAIRTGANVKPLPGETIREVLPIGPRELVREAMSDDDEKRRAQLASGYYYRQQRRFAATIASPGGRALLLLDHIDAMGGSCTGAALAERTGWTRHEISRLVGRLVGAGCVVKPDRRSVQVCDGWQATLDATVVEMPTFGSKAVLEAQLLDAREAYQTQRLREAVDCKDPAQYERMRIRIAAIMVTLDTIAKLRATLAAWAITTMQDRHEPVLKRILTRYASQDAREAAELRNRAAAGRRRLASTERAAAQRATYYQRQGLAGGQVAHMLQVDGFSHHTIGAVMQ